MMKYIRKALFLFTLITIIYSCSQDNDGEFPNTNISAASFLSILQDNSDITIIDVRTEEEYNAGHLEKAILMDVNNATFRDKVMDLDTSLTYYVYCRTGNRSLQAVKHMKSVGMEHVYNIEGGINALISAGVKTVK